MSGTNVLKRGQTSVANSECSGQTSTSKCEENIQKLWKVIRSNGCLTVCEVAEEAGVSKTMCHMILTENLCMHHVAAKFVPCLPNEDQKQNRAIVSKELVNCANADENFLKHCLQVMKLGFTALMSKQKPSLYIGSQKCHPDPKEAWQVQSNVKVMLAVFLNCEGIICHEFLSRGQTVNKEYYLKVMKTLRDAMRRKKSGLWREKMAAPSGRCSGAFLPSDS
jgi:hypothetical protein